MLYKQKVVSISLVISWYSHKINGNIGSYTVIGHSRTTEDMALFNNYFDVSKLSN